MTTLLYQTDSYLKEFDAIVTAVDAEARTLCFDQTAFYPGGGGQPCDRGTLLVNGKTLAIEKVKKSGVDVLHFAAADCDLPLPGTPVHGVLNWERRYQLMRTHSAMHVLCGVIWRDYGASVTGGDMDPLQGRMDFEFERFSGELAGIIETAINAEVTAARGLRVHILPRDEAFAIPDLIRTKINLLPPGIPEVRTVEIIGLDLQADGGTHVHNTSEIGYIRVVEYKSKGKINKRIYVAID